MKHLTSLTVVAATLLCGATVSMAQVAPSPPAPAATPEPPAPVDIQARAEAEAASRTRSRIGVTLGSIDETLASHLKLDPEQVVLITSVIAGAPAEEAGVQAHDILTHVNGNAPVTQDLLREIVQATEPGQQIELTVVRGGESRDISVTVEKVEVSDVFGQGLATFNLSDLTAEELARELSDLVSPQRDLDEQELRSTIENFMRRNLRRRGGGAERFVVPFEFPADVDVQWDYRFETDPREMQRWQRRQEVEIRRDDDGREVMIVRPTRPGAAPRPSAPQNREVAEAQRARLERLEERLDRIERMLQQLLEERN